MSANKGEDAIRVRRTYAVSLVAAILIVAGIAAASASSWTPNRQTLNVRRHHVMEIRKDRCLHTWDMQRLPDVLTPAQLRWKWGWWGALKEKSRHIDSKCMSDQLLVWYQLSGARCVHEHEGAWNDPNPPYWGGFQADLSFQSTYNPKAYATYGTADHWPIIEQIRMAYYGHLARGWAPWLTTARLCGLL